MLSGGQQRAWIKDGDEIILRGWIHDAKTGEQLFGFGECRGIVLLNPYRNVE
jgi:fumarylacetoacetase